MAKEQNLSLNPSKISGVCGRLMCCLKNEEEAYEYLNSTLPHINDTVKTIDGYEGIVQSVGVLKQKIKVIVTKEIDENALKELEEMEQNDIEDLAGEQQQRTNPPKKYNKKPYNKPNQGNSNYKQNNQEHKNYNSKPYKNIQHTNDIKKHNRYNNGHNYNTHTDYNSHHHN